ncbi:ATP-binding cassette domain-containing protein [Nitriliruptor alkaliphilus]|uniref:ATP-binding cassette domain-containing protein n=1 Tax=Nitriliruptor alkaliphilus TaxID=427918 RepID=UPI0006972E4B|nr:ATP-binding cassette domain-containing protein [Nitriliruptor alkaliphilus]
MIRARELTRTFTVKKDDPVVAVDAIDLDVEEGELVAFLGPNGAGKSTTLRMLTTLLPPTAGTANVAGFDVTTEAAKVRRRLGYIGQGNGAGHYHRVRDEVVLQGRAYGLAWRDARQRADELLEALQLTSMAKRGAGTLSGGQRRRLDIAMGLVHAPPLLFLDEPSTGLDPQNRANLWEHVLGVRERFGTTLFLTTHYLDEAERMAERVIVIDHGKVIADDTPARLKAELAGDEVTIGLSDPGRTAAAVEVADRLGRLHAVRVDGADVHLRIPDGAQVLPGYLRQLDANGIEVERAEVSRPTLDDVFLHLTGRSLREEAQAADDARSREDGVHTTPQEVLA